MCASPRSAATRAVRRSSMPALAWLESSQLRCDTSSASHDPRIRLRDLAGRRSLRHLPLHASACGRLNASILGWTYLAQHQLLPAQPRNRQVDGGAPRQAAGREGDRGCCWTPPAFPQAVPAIADGTPGRVLIGRSGAISLALGHECDGQRGCGTSKPLRAAQSMHAMAIHRAQAAIESRQLAIVVLCLPRPTLAVHLDSSTSMHRYLSLAAGAARDQVKPEFCGM